MTGTRAESVARTQPWWRIAWYPAVFPAAIIVQAWAAAAIHPAALYRPLLFGVVVTIVITLALSALCRNRDLGALAAMALVTWVVAAAIPAASLVLLPTAGLVVLVGLAKRGRPWPIGALVTRLMSIVATIIVLAVGISLLQSGALGRGLTEITGDAADRGPSGPPRQPPRTSTSSCSTATRARRRAPSTRPTRPATSARASANGASTWRR